MKPRIRSRIAAAVFASMTLLLSLSLVLTPARSAQKPSLLYATAEAGTKLIAISLEAKRVRVIGDTGFPFSLALAPCPPSVVRYTITNTFDPTNAQLATLNLGTGAATRAGSPLGQALSIMGMTCSPDGTLYAVGQADPSKPDFNSLYTVNRETGLASRIGSTGVLDPSDPSGLCLDFAGAVVESNGRGLVDHDTLVPGIDAHVNCTKSIAKSAENKVNNGRRLLREIRVRQSIDDGLRLIRRPQKTAGPGLLAKV